MPAQGQPPIATQPSPGHQHAQQRPLLNAPPARPRARPSPSPARRPPAAPPAGTRTEIEGGRGGGRDVSGCDASSPGSPSASPDAHQAALPLPPPATPCLELPGGGRRLRAKPLRLHPLALQALGGLQCKVEQEGRGEREGEVWEADRSSPRRSSAASTGTDSVRSRAVSLPPPPSLPARPNPPRRARAAAREPRRRRQTWPLSRPPAPRWWLPPPANSVGVCMHGWRGAGGLARRHRAVEAGRWGKRCTGRGAHARRAKNARTLRIASARRCSASSERSTRVFSRCTASVACRSSSICGRGQKVWSARGRAAGACQMLLQGLLPAQRRQHACNSHRLSCASAAMCCAPGAAPRTPRSWPPCEACRSAPAPWPPPP